MSRGARPAAANDKDQIPLDLAAFNGHMHVVEFFLAQSRDLEGDNVTATTTTTTTTTTTNGKGECGGGLAAGIEDVEMDEGGDVEDADR